MDTQELTGGGPTPGTCASQQNEGAVVTPAQHLHIILAVPSTAAQSHSANL